MMNNEYKIDAAKITEIAKKFNLREDQVEELQKQYLRISPSIKEQYLAHIMRSLECYFRNVLGYNRFIVLCEPYKNTSHGQKKASADYFQGSKFIINYDDSLPDLEKRDYIAHEIGHLFLLAELDAANKDKRRKMYEGITEPLCSVFGVFAMSEKNDWYANYDITVENHKDWQHILDNLAAVQAESL